SRSCRSCSAPPGSVSAPEPIVVGRVEDDDSLAGPVPLVTAVAALEDPTVPVSAPAEPSVAAGSSPEG
ncbi:MAG: hypothetical protein KUG77_20460, partial [Nannocystaceae bacterium]|nr:hypothetical protein [Nannocystaceae bacterium]